MKKLVAVSLIMAGMVLVGGFHTLTQAQSPGIDAKPTILSPTPGLYVNGWPAFSLSYPKEWVEQHPMSPTDIYTAAVLRPPLPPGPSFTINVWPAAGGDVNDAAKWYANGLAPFGEDIKVLYTKPTKLQDGTPALEAEIEWVLRVVPEKPKIHTFVLAAIKDDVLTQVGLHEDRGMVGDDLKHIAYSLTFLKSRNEPMNVPHDVRAFLDKYCADVVSRDAERIMADYSDQFLYSSAKKADVDRMYRNGPFSLIPRSVVSYEATVMAFEAQGDKAYVAGFFVSKAKPDANAVKAPMYFQQIIKENGQWRWYGTQK